MEKQPQSPEFIKPPDYALLVQRASKESGIPLEQMLRFEDEIKDWVQNRYFPKQGKLPSDDRIVQEFKDVSTPFSRREIESPIKGTPDFGAATEIAYNEGGDE